jgi:hypothetical protein
MKFAVPLYLKVGKKNYWLNQNGYRNWHYHLSNKLKSTFKEQIAIPDKKLNGEVTLIYTFYYPNKIRRDIGNSLAVIDKFTADALIENGNIEDDDYKIVKKIIGQFGEIDKENPRCEVEIIENYK